MANSSARHYRHGIANPFSGWRHTRINSSAEKPRYLVCESKAVFFLLIFTGGIMGAYTYNLRGGVFCNAQTANFVLMAMAFGKGDVMSGLYYVIPITAYFAGAFVSEIIPTEITHPRLLRWDTVLIAVEAAAFVLIGFIPLSAPHHITQVAINFLASMQYNTFRQAEGIPGATTFCTNHLRQVGIACAHFIHRRDNETLRRVGFHVGMLLFFVAGAAVETALCSSLQEKAIWVAVIPMACALGKLARADLTTEHDLIDEKPHGH